jgi:predicted RNase H-like HicB family nuclease
MKYAYAAIFTPDEKGLYSVRFPDLPGCCTCGENIPDTVNMAQDALCLWLYDLEQDKKPIPQAHNPQNIITKAGEFLSVVAVDTEIYRRFYETKSIKKTLKIPMWLNEHAERANVNLSHLLQEALKTELCLSE